MLSIADLRVRKTSRFAAFELRVDHLDIEAGSRLALIGPSGCGKSTLLDILALVLIPDQVGSFYFTSPDGSPIDLKPLLERQDLDRLGELRRAYAGYVLQTGGLLPFTTVRVNIGLPLLLLGRPAHPAVEQIASALGIAAQLDKKPAELSAGERQRVAIARALVHRPLLVLADEPTAALDPARSDAVMRLFVELADAIGSTLIVASHDVARIARFGFTPLRHEFLADPPPGVTVARFAL
jgi:putative ABC transport system ATP-binding protein